jgi:hypothetical protein
MLLSVYLKSNEVSLAVIRPQFHQAESAEAASSSVPAMASRDEKSQGESWY